MPAFQEIGNFFFSHGSQFDSHNTSTAANPEKFFQVYMKKKIEWGEKPKPPKTLDFTPLPSLLRKISLLFMWWQLPLILKTVWSLLEPDCRPEAPRRPMTNERRNWLFSHIIFGFSQGANMCLLSNHYLTQFKDTELISVQGLQVMCKYVFGYRQLCKCQVTLIQQSSVRRIIMGKGNKNTEVMHGDITNAKWATDFFHSSPISHLL